MYVLTTSTRTSFLKKKKNVKIQTHENYITSSKRYYKYSLKGSSFWDHSSLNYEKK